jgi:hypothetical protein
MKRKLLLTLLIFSTFLPTCTTRGNAYEAGDELVNERGTIQQLSANPQWYIIVPDFDPTTRFLPSNLPTGLRKDGIKVLFSGKVGEIPANARLIGIPLDLKRIKQIE